MSVAGPSGCGTSTLRRLISGLEIRSIGSARVATDRVENVIQDLTLLPWRSVRGYVELAAELEEIPRVELVGAEAGALPVRRQFGGAERVGPGAAKAVFPNRPGRIVGELSPTSIASPAMVMWDRTKCPDVTRVADLGRDGVPVLRHQADTFIQYLPGAGLLEPEQGRFF